MRKTDGADVIVGIYIYLAVLCGSLILYHNLDFPWNIIPLAFLVACICVTAVGLMVLPLLYTSGNNK